MRGLCFFLSLLFLLCCLAGCGGGKDCSCTVCCLSAETGDAVEGVVFSFCSDTACATVVSDETGTAVFTGPAAEYHVQIVAGPEGWELPEDESVHGEWVVGPSGETRRILFAEVGK